MRRWTAVPKSCDSPVPAGLQTRAVRAVRRSELQLRRRPVSIVSGCPTWAWSAALGVSALLMLAGPSVRAQDDRVIWLEAESGEVQTGEVFLIDPTTSDFGNMARSDASGERFVRVAMETKLSLPPVRTDEAATWHVWVRAFPITGRRAVVVIDGKEVGTTAGDSDSVALVWHAVAEVKLAAGEHRVELWAAEDNINVAYVDVVALLRDPDAMPVGKGPEDIVSGERVARVEEGFAGSNLAELAATWKTDPPPGEDAVVELLPGQDDGVLHIHNGSGQTYRITSRQVLDVGPGDQVTVRVRLRKGTLCERLTIGVLGVGAFSPQLYRSYQEVERTWIVPPERKGPVLVQLVGAGGGDTYISRVEAFRPDPPVSSFETGRFLPAPNLRREGRLFEIEAYVVNSDAFSEETDTDNDGLWSLCRLSREDNTPYFSRGTVLKSDAVPADRGSPGDGCPPLHVRVGPLEAGRYETYLNVPGRALAYSADGEEWQRFGGDAAPSLGVVEITEPYIEFWLDDRYAERGDPGPTYVDYIRFMPIEDPAYTMAPAEAPKPFRRGVATCRPVWLTVGNPTSARRRSEPVRFGLPIPEGELADADHCWLLDDWKRAVPCFAQVTGRWPDGSVKWLLLDFEADVPPNSATRLTLQYGNEVQRADLPDPFSVEREGDKLSVDTGATRFVFDGQRGGCFSAFVPGDDQPQLVLEDAEMRAADGRLWRASAETTAQIGVEERTPFRVVVRIRGRYGNGDGPGPLAFDHRVHLFAGRPECLLEYGFVASADEPTIPLKHVGLRLAGPWAQGPAVFGLDAKESQPQPADGQPRLLQTGDNAYGSGGEFPYTLADASGATTAEGERADGWLRLGGEPSALFCLPHFWQQFPKAISCDGQSVTVDLWPDAEGVEPFIAHAGAGKSHRVGISLGEEALPERWLRPLFASCEPEWYCATGAFEDLVPRRPDRYEPYEAIVDAAFETLLQERAGYGMENWGDVWQGGYVPGAKTWSNQEWDLVNNWVIPFIRTGDRRFLDFAHEAARHYADVDCIHYAENERLIGGAWMHAHTSLRGHQLEPPNFAHAGWVEGMLNIYHLTGDRRGLEAAEGVAQYIARHAPQVERMPEQGPAYNLMIQRPAGWPLTTLCLVYRETWDPVYLQTARRIVDYARRCQDPERGAWDAQVGHEAPYRGGCVFAYTLFRGLRLFADITGEARAREDYVKAARWVFGEMWRPGHQYLYEQCPLHEPGTRVPFILSEMAGYTTRLSGDPIYGAIGFDALREHSAPAANSWMADRGAAAQWGNGILTQVPRMLYDWEQTGLSVDESVTLRPQQEPVKMPLVGGGRVALTLRNGSRKALRKLAASCLIRGDWRAEIATCPETVPSGAEASIELQCEPPPPTARYELQNDLAHLHVLARYEQDERPGVVWGYCRLEIAKPLEVAGPAAIAVKRGGEALLHAGIVDRTDPEDQVQVTAETDLVGIVLGEAQVASSGESQLAVSIPVTAGPEAEPGQGRVAITARSGRHSATAEIPVEIGRFRVAVIEDTGSAEWHRPFDHLVTYPGIAPELIAADEVPERLPASADEMARRWEVIAIGDLPSGAATFTPEQLAAVAEFIGAGGGLVTAGGPHSYRAGGYSDTRLSGILPFDISGGRYQPGPVAVQIPDRDLRLFEGYDPVFPALGARHLVKAKPDATVVAEFSDGRPFVALREVGEGRVLSFAAPWNGRDAEAFSTWREYGRFVGRCVRWAARDLELRKE